MERKVVTYKCDCCKQSFSSGRVRSGEKLCEACIGLRRALKGYIKRGLSNVEVLRRAKKLLVQQQQEA